MSAGNFTFSKYADDAGNVYSAKIQPETLNLTLNGQGNAAPAGDIDQPIRARMSGGRRGYGVRARSVRIQFTAAPPAGYSPDDILEVPVLTLAAFTEMKAVRDATGTYLGTAVRLIGSTPESVR